MDTVTSTSCQGALTTHLDFLKSFFVVNFFYMGPFLQVLEVIAQSIAKPSCSGLFTVK